MTAFDLPRWHAPDAQHTIIVGRTGTGKTRFAFWLLSCAPLDTMPFIVVDYKREGLFRYVRRIREIGLNEKIPNAPGLYVIRPNPQTDDDEAVEAFLWRLWKQGRTGLYCDEGYLVPDKGGALNAILTQGRSKGIPVIFLAQRPAWLSRFVFSEASFYAVFQLNDRDDEKKIERVLPRGIMEIPRPLYHAIWYEVSHDKAVLLKPVPDAQLIADAIDAKLTANRRFA